MTTSTDAVAAAAADDDVSPTKQRVRVRRAGPKDAAVVHAMLIELATHEGSADAVRSSLEDWQRMLADPAVVVLVAFIRDEPVGYVSGVRQLNLWIGDDNFAMDDLYVRPHVRDRGIGGRLMAALADLCTVDQLLITWGVREDNTAGHRFYRRLGATLRSKTVATWQPLAYDAYLDVRSHMRSAKIGGRP
jgi:ribosomal protein S18 acetylase RimI-like enzyme